MVQCLSLRKRKLIPSASFISLQIDKSSVRCFYPAAAYWLSTGGYRGLIITWGGFVRSQLSSSKEDVQFKIIPQIILIIAP